MTICCARGGSGLGESADRWPRAIAAGSTAASDGHAERRPRWRAMHRPGRFSAIDGRELAGERETRCPSAVANDSSVAAFPCRRRLRMSRVEQVEGHDAGEDDDERDDELQGGGEHDAFLALGERFRAERPLGDVLVEAPVEEVRDPQADDQRRPRDGRVGSPAGPCAACRRRASVEQAEAFRRAGSASWAGSSPGATAVETSAAGSALPGPFIARTSTIAPPTIRADALEQVGPGARLQSAGRHVHGRQDADHPASRS